MVLQLQVLGYLEELIPLHPYLSKLDLAAVYQPFPDIGDELYQMPYPRVPEAENPLIRRLRGTVLKRQSPSGACPYGCSTSFIYIEGTGHFAFTVTAMDTTVRQHGPFRRREVTSKVT